MKTIAQSGGPEYYNFQDIHCIEVLVKKSSSPVQSIEIQFLIGSINIYLAINSIN